MRKWTKSACVIVALGIMALLAVAGSRGPGQPAQAKISIASSTSSTSAKTAPAARPGATLMTATASLLTAAPARTWTVRPGDTLSSIAAALGVRGGWQALYTANRAVVGADPNVIRPGITLTVPGKATPLRYAVEPGDTLSGIASALAVHGGWQALYATNRQVIGVNPNVIRTGTVLVAPGGADGQPGRTTPQASVPQKAPAPAKAPAPGPRASGSGTGKTPATTRPAPAGSPGPARSPRSTPASGGGLAASVMPSWLKGTLLVAAVLTLLAFILEPALLLARRRRLPGGARPGMLAAILSLGQRACEQHAAAKVPRIVQAEHERLIVTYCVSDDTVYLLTPPGEDPRSVLRAARLVLPEDTYEELAGHLGVPSGWRVD